MIIKNKKSAEIKDNTPVTKETPVIKKDPKPKKDETLSLHKEIEKDEVLNKIIDDALDEIEKSQKEELEDLEASNNQILKETLDNRSKAQDIKNDLHILRSKENEHFIEVMKELHFIKKHMNKIAVLTLVIVFFCGYIFGTQHEHINPYIGKVLDILNLFKGNGGQ